MLASKHKGASVKLADFGLAVEAMDGKHYYGTYWQIRFILYYRAVVFVMRNLFMLHHFGVQVQYQLADMGEK